ncbi:MAG: FAD-dependent oxidoreductase, partial [Clostridia bacterium]|nr:FAD-dependent oxidoreductase [Clostridia bacterium]
ITDDGVMFVDTVCDENHRIISTGDTPTFMQADSVMICISQRPSNMILTQTKGLEVNERGLAKIADNGETTREGVFASGDVVKGAKTVVEAVEQSKRVAYAMHEYLQGLNK